MLSELETQTIIQRYQQGESSYTLAEEFGCYRRTICDTLKRNGVEVSHPLVFGFSDYALIFEGKHSPFAVYTMPEIGSVIEHIVHQRQVPVIRVFLKWLPFLFGEICRRRENLPGSKFPCDFVVTVTVIRRHLEHFPHDGRGLLIDLKDMLVIPRFAVPLRCAGCDKFAVLGLGFKGLPCLS